jgi:hypothetical protein
MKHQFRKNVVCKDYVIFFQTIDGKIEKDKISCDSIDQARMMAKSIGAKKNMSVVAVGEMLEQHT